ncbi:XRE family transcriptional regulator [Prauserella sp. ASG 168]|uniref:XRE family transcriptional regulator n=1 Tax=Prauserella cavernicola TaxID=2800127 RepID=A0A934QN16_9PSEU|nr:XRE family transcriptional regulator [Prauserella cavernicola]
MPTKDGEGDNVQRRQLLKAASSTVTLVGASLLGAPATTTTQRSRTLGKTDIKIVREMTGVFRRLDNRYGGGHTHAAATVSEYLTVTVKPMLQDGVGTDVVRADLFLAAAEMHQLAGWIAYDIGKRDAGRRWLREALKLCQDAGDDALEAEMLAGMSHHAAFDHSPGTAVDLALAARRTARRSGLPALAAEAAAMEAHGHAMQGNVSACFAALHDAERAFGRVVGSDGPEWLNYFDAAYLAAKFAHTFRALGRPGEAERFARRSLEMSDGYERGRLFNTALLASTLADQGRVEEACTTGGAAMHMARTVRSVRGAEYLADVGRRLSPYRGHADVCALYTQMGRAGLATPPA